MIKRNYGINSYEFEDYYSVNHTNRERKEGITNKWRYLDDIFTKNLTKHQAIKEGLNDHYDEIEDQAEIDFNEWFEETFLKPKQEEQKENDYDCENYW